MNHNSWHKGDLADELISQGRKKTVDSAQVKGSLEEVPQTT